MNCKECEIILYDYVKGNLSKNEAREIGEHIKICPKCKVKESEYKAYLSMLPSYEDNFSYPEKLNAKIKSELAKQIKDGNKKKSFVFTPRYYVYPVLTAAVIMIAIFTPSYFNDIKHYHDDNKVTEISQSEIKTPAKIEPEKDAVVVEPKKAEEPVVQNPKPTEKQKSVPKNNNKNNNIVKYEPNIKSQKQAEPAILPEPIAGIEDKIPEQIISDKKNTNSDLIVQNEVKKDENSAQANTPLKQSPPTDDKRLKNTTGTANGSNNALENRNAIIDNTIPYAISSNAPMTTAIDEKYEMTVAEKERDLLVKNFTCEQLSEDLYLVNATQKEITNKIPSAKITTQIIDDNVNVKIID